MTIGDLIDNPCFSFNAPFRILWVRDHGTAESTYTTVVYDTTVSPDMPFDLMFKTIVAINTGDDGVLEIEYADMYGD